MLIHYSFYIPVEDMKVQKIEKIRTITIKSKKEKYNTRKIRYGGWKVTDNIADSFSQFNLNL